MTLLLLGLELSTFYRDSPNAKCLPCTYTSSESMHKNGYLSTVYNATYYTFNGMDRDCSPRACPEHKDVTIQHTV